MTTRGWVKHSFCHLQDQIETERLPSIRLGGLESRSTPDIRRMYRTQDSYGRKGSGHPAMAPQHSRFVKARQGSSHPPSHSVQPTARPYLLAVLARRGPQPSSSEPFSQSTAPSHGPPFRAQSPLAQLCLVPGHRGADGGTVENTLLRTADITQPTLAPPASKLTCTWLTAQ